MAATEKIVIITDLHGRVLAAELPGGAEHSGKEQAPTGHLVTLDGQRALHIDVPREILELPGPDLHRYFSDLRIGPDGKVELPKIKIEKTHKK